MALDVGERRIGISFSDPMKIIASPHSTIDRKQSADIFLDIIKLTKEFDVETIVVGLPITLKGNSSIQTKNVINFISDLEKTTTISIDTIDERLSSVSAKKELIKKGIKTGHNKSEIDKIAATLMLQEYIDSQ